MIPKLNKSPAFIFRSTTFFQFLYLYTAHYFHYYKFNAEISCKNYCLYFSQSTFMDNLNSRERIQKAFPSLLKTVRIEKITIAGIIDEAGVSRTTVYRYYYDQKEILTKS